MDLQEYTSLVGPGLKFIQILGQGSHGLAVQITDEDARPSVNYAMKIGYTKDCLVDDGSDFDYQKEYTIGKLMGQLGIGPEIYKVGCAMGSGYNYPYIIMELFEADCDIAAEYAVQMNDAQLLTYIYKECIYIIRSMINENHYFTDIKTGNFVIKNFRNSGLPSIKMIDFDEQYRLQPYDALSPVKKVLPTLLIIQIFFMNLGPIVDRANLYLNTYIQIFSRYLKKYQRNYPIFKQFIDTNPVIKNRLEWYLQENVFKYVNNNIFKDSKGNMITDVSEQISCAIYEVYPDSLSNSFGRLPQVVRRSALRLQASRRKASLRRPTARKTKLRSGADSGRARTPFAARERSPTRRFSTWRSHSVAKPTMQRLCLTFKNVPRFVDNPNNDKPTIYKTIDELLASTVNKITSF